ncbi:MAG TPA: alpha/beta hydrolase [Polyangiaceae bacterium]|nr:alpha/beta hydrolase [Polyangiaceae bacterium]
MSPRPPPSRPDAARTPDDAPDASSAAPAAAPAAPAKAPTPAGGPAASTRASASSGGPAAPSGASTALGASNASAAAAAASGGPALGPGEARAAGGWHDLREWREGGRFVDFVGTPVFARARGRASAASPAVFFLHGVPASSHDFARLWPRLAARRALGAFDFVGFGLSGDARGFGYGLVDQADVALAVAAALGIGRAHLVAHDVGGAVAAELLARRERGLLPLQVESLTLLGGGPLAGLGRAARSHRLVRKLAAGGRPARAASFALFRRDFERSFAEPEVLGPDEARRAWGLFVEGQGAPRSPQALAYGDELLRPPARWWASLARLGLPALVLWGGGDRVVGPEQAQQLGRHVPGARVRTLPGLGHAPHLEAPGVVAAELEAFWDDLDGP